MSNFKFDSYIYDEVADEDLTIEVEVLSYSPGAKATYWEPEEDSHLELAVYLNDGADMWATLDPSIQDRLIEEAYKQLEG